MESKLHTNVNHLSTITAAWPADTATPDASNIQNEAELPDSTNVNTNIEDSECFKESLVCDGDFQIDVEPLGDGEFSCHDTIDITNEAAGAFEKRAVKYQPKPKALSDRQRDSADGLRMSIDGNFSFDPSVDQPDTVVSEDSESSSLENQQQSAANPKEKMSCDTIGSSANSVAEEGIVSGFEGNEFGYDMLDGMNGEFHDNSSLNGKVPDESASNRDENNDGDHLLEKSSKKKRVRKSKKATSENAKPARKRRKMAAEKPDGAIVEPPKKFPRGTRRKRCVDKSLLEAPEDELDLQRVPIRELIILAEYKERQAKKQTAATAAPPPPTNESNENMLTEDPLYDDDGSFGFDKDGDAFDNPSTAEVVTKDTGYFNYHTYMKKEPRAKWTKHDTELFYKGISQFGSDMSMIQQLFPGRTRNQIKLKYKKEERQNPMRLNDALTNRAQDLSHFELVIARLQEQAAQEAKSDREDSGCRLGKDEETEVNTNNENVANCEQDKQGSVAEQEPVKHQVESPSKSYYSEDDEIDWGAYKSEW